MSTAAKDANNTKRYISHPLQELPGEKYVSVSYKDIFGDEDIPKGVKRGGKYLAEVVSNKKSMEAGVDGLELPVKTSRASLSTWMYCVMNSKCYNDGSQDCDPTLWKICGLLLDACDCELPVYTIDGVIVMKVLGISLCKLVQVITSSVDDYEVSDLESVDSDMSGVSVTAIHDRLVKQVRAKKEFCSESSSLAAPDRGCRACHC